MHFGRQRAEAERPGFTHQAAGDPIPVRIVRRTPEMAEEFGAI
jgi:hypothetical protein